MSPEFDTTISSSTIGLGKAVVSLNNSGVTLLERARCSEAKATLKDALNLASFYNKAFSSTRPCQHQYLSHQMNMALHLAEQHLARPCSPLENESMTKNCITILSNDDTSGAMETAASDFCSSQNLFAVRIFSSDDDADYTENNWHYVLGVLLQNFSVACQCPPTTLSGPLAEGDDSPFYSRVQAHQRNEEAWSACHMAHELLSRHSTLHGTTTTLMEFAFPEIQRRWILMHMLVVSNLMHLAFELGKRRHGYKYYDKLCRLRDDLPQAAPTDDGSRERIDAAFSFCRRTAPAA